MLGDPGQQNSDHSCVHSTEPIRKIFPFCDVVNIESRGLLWGYILPWISRGKQPSWLIYFEYPTILSKYPRSTTSMIRALDVAGIVLCCRAKFIQEQSL